MRLSLSQEEKGSELKNVSRALLAAWLKRQRFVESFHSNWRASKSDRFEEEERNESKTVYVSKLNYYDRDKATIKKQAIKWAAMKKLFSL